MVYYNENDPGAAAWLRELVAAGQIEAGVVDERSIVDVQKESLKGHTQAHFFGGIGGWSLALRLAGWPGDQECWTGSCPCPPFSQAGKRKSCPACGGRPIPCPRRTGYFICLTCEHAWYADGRHLWPEFFRLIQDRLPATVFGEQVSGPDGLIWLAGVRASLEAIGYAVGALDLPAACVGSPNIRQRLFWVANANGRGRGPQRQRGGLAEVHGTAAVERLPVAESGADVRLADAECDRLEGSQSASRKKAARGRRPAIESLAGGLGNAVLPGPQGRGPGVRGEPVDSAGREPPAKAGGSGFWDRYTIIPCRDGKFRRIPRQPQSGNEFMAHGVSACVVPLWDAGYDGTFPLAEGVKGRVGILRGAGNAVNPFVAAKFVRAFLEAEQEQ